VRNDEAREDCLDLRDAAARSHVHDLALGLFDTLGLIIGIGAHSREIHLRRHGQASCNDAKEQRRRHVHGVGGAETARPRQPPIALASVESTACAAVHPDAFGAAALFPVGDRLDADIDSEGDSSRQDAYGKGSHPALRQIPPRVDAGADAAAEPRLDLAAAHAVLDQVMEPVDGGVVVVGQAVARVRRRRRLVLGGAGEERGATRPSRRGRPVPGGGHEQRRGLGGRARLDRCVVGGHGTAPAWLCVWRLRRSPAS